MLNVYLSIKHRLWSAIAFEGVNSYIYARICLYKPRSAILSASYIPNYLNILKSLE